MPSPARENYLVTEVMTAPPQKLQLMLIEAAIRCAESARQKWRTQDDQQAWEALVRAQEIVGQLLAGLNHEADPQLVKKVAGIYLFVFRSLVEATHQHSEKKLDDALRVLVVQRETWRQVCEKLGVVPAPIPHTASLAEQPALGLSLEA